MKVRASLKIWRLDERLLLQQFLTSLSSLTARVSSSSWRCMAALRSIKPGGSAISRGEPEDAGSRQEWGMGVGVAIGSYKVRIT